MEIVDSTIIVYHRVSRHLRNYQGNSNGGQLLTNYCHPRFILFYLNHETLLLRRLYQDEYDTHLICGML